MSYPQKTYSNFTQILSDINNLIVTNGAGDIDGVVLNNVLNGAITFIEQSTLNYNLAKIEQSGGSITLSSSITIVRAVIPTSLTWGDNVYNQWVVINQLSSSVPLLGGISYIDIFGNPQTSIPANTTIILYKVSNGQWVNSNI